MNVTVAPRTGAPALSTSVRIAANSAPVPAVRHVDVSRSVLAAFTVRFEQLHIPVGPPAHVQVKHALPPVQSRGDPPEQTPEPLQV
jgi:hypothetical protein